MSLIGQRAKAVIRDESGYEKEIITGVILDKIRSTIKVLNDFPDYKGMASTASQHIAVDYYIIKTEDGVKFALAKDYLGYPEKETSGITFIGSV